MRYSLGFILAISLAGLQFLAIIIVVSTSFVSSERAMLDHARGLMRDAGLNAVDHTKRFLEPARESADLASRILQSEVVSTADPAEMERYLFRHLQSKAQLSGIYYGDEAGNFVYVMRSDGPGLYRTKFVAIDGEERTIELIWRTEDFSVVERVFDPEDIFDPRGRQWYINARTAKTGVWTSPYIFFSSQQPGITVAAPVLQSDGALEGVVGVDIEIAEISEFLSGLAIGTEGTAIILSDSAEVIAHPDQTQISVENADGTLGFARIEDLGDPVARMALNDFNPGAASTLGPMQSEFAYQGNRFMTLLLPISGIDLPWTIAVFAPENDFVQGIKDNRRRNIWIAAIVCLVTAVVGVVLAELILRPVRAFAVRTALVSQGEVSTNAPLPRTYQELRKANQTLIHEIAQRRDADRKVEKLSRDMSHFSRVNVMGQMATGLAHELSQPLTAITQNVDAAITVAKQNSNPSAELLSILTELEEQAHQGGDIIRALRGFVRKDEGKAEHFDLSELIAQTSRLMQNETGTHGVTIDAELASLPLAIGNRVQIAQVLINLMRNAVDAMVATGSTPKQIIITARQIDDKIEIWVDDTGPGVAEDVTLFKQFQTSKPDGLGLGLSISRSIIEANGGHLWYDRTGADRSRFCFTVVCETS
jgi:C4-dicarboxylate-specific signal transduction histidine kinase